MSDCLPLLVKSWFGTFDYLVDCSSQLSGQQNLLAVLIGKCWAQTGNIDLILLGQVFENFQNASVVIIGCFHLWERSVWAVECLTALYTGPLWVTDSWAGSLLTGWLHTVSLYPLTGWYCYPCDSPASRRKTDVNSCWQETLSDVGRAMVLICAKAVETCSLILWTRGELSQLPGWSCQ